MDIENLKLIIEALIFASDVPLSINKIISIVPGVDILDVEEAISKLIDDYANRAIMLKKLKTGYVFQTREAYSQFIAKLSPDKISKYSSAVLETLAIIAYRQPVTRADIEDVRGVAVSTNIIRTLEDRDWIKISGYKDAIGKPALYVTTNAFLEHFQLDSLDELPVSNIESGLTKTPKVETTSR